MKNTSFVLVALFLFLFSSCKKEGTTGPADVPTSGTATFTLNGAGFTNLTITVSNVMAGFEAAENMTGVIGSKMAAGDTTWLTLAFPGSTTGTFQFTDSSGVVISRQTGTTRGFVNGVGGGQIVVTAYGNVAGSVTGTFSGKLYEVTGSGLDSVTVSGGTFNAVRVN